MAFQNVQLPTVQFLVTSRSSSSVSNEAWASVIMCIACWGYTLVVTDRTDTSCYVDARDRKCVCRVLFPLLRRLLRGEDDSMADTPVAASDFFLQGPVNLECTSHFEDISPDE